MKPEIVEMINITATILFISATFLGAFYIMTTGSDRLTHPEMECVKEFSKSN